jgi:hypothetical protein
LRGQKKSDFGDKTAQEKIEIDMCGVEEGKQ